MPMDLELARRLFLRGAAAGLGGVAIGARPIPTPNQTPNPTPPGARTFNGHPRDATFRGAYSGEGVNPGWALALGPKP